MRDIAFSHTHTRLARARRFWIRPGHTNEWLDNFVSQTVVPEEWKENFRMSRPSLLKLSEERGKIDLTADSQRVSVDGRKRYEHSSVDADQLMRFR